MFNTVRTGFAMTVPKNHPCENRLSALGLELSVYENKGADDDDDDDDDHDDHDDHVTAILNIWLAPPLKI